MGWKAPALKGTVRTAQPKSGGCGGGLGLPAVRQRLRLWRQRSALARKRVRRSSRSCARSQYRSSSSCATSKKEELVARLGDALSNAEQPVEKRNFSKAEVLKMLDLPEMQNLLRQKRLRWVGHALRRKDGDLSKDTVKQELTRKSSTWTACVLSDMEALNIGSVVASEREANRESALAASRY